MRKLKFLQNIFKKFPNTEGISDRIILILFFASVIIFISIAQLKNNKFMVEHQILEDYPIYKTYTKIYEYTMIINPDLPEAYPMGIYDCTYYRYRILERTSSIQLLPDGTTIYSSEGISENGIWKYMPETNVLYISQLGFFFVSPPFEKFSEREMNNMGEPVTACVKRE